jgi:hypothetical protein
MKKIPQDVYEKIQQQEIQNILKKLKTGKVLTKQERELLKEAKAAGEEVNIKEDNYPKHTKSNSKMRNWIQDKFQLSERKSYQWLSKLDHMRTSNGWPVADVMSEIQERKKQQTAGPLTDLKREKLQEEILILRNRRLQEQGKVITIEEHHTVLSEHAELVKGPLRNWIQKVASECRDPRLQEWAEKTYDDVRLRLVNAMSD